MRNSNTKEVLLRMLELALRWHVSLSMFVYGFAKTMQFGPTAEVATPVNELAGQELMWAFYGYSIGYAKFLGVVEMFGAVLLLFRRTTLLGCLVVTTVLMNVIVQDIVYGVLQGALRAAIIYQVLTLFVVLLNREQVARAWKALTTPGAKTTTMRWYWLAFGALGIMILTLSLEHAITH